MAAAPLASMRTVHALGPLAADALQKMGYTNVWSMAGGIGGWFRAGHRIDQG